MFKDVKENFMDPLISIHTQSGGNLITNEQKEAICAMLLAKITWDSNLGNNDLTKCIRMFDHSFLDKLGNFDKK